MLTYGYSYELQRTVLCDREKHKRGRKIMNCFQVFFFTNTNLQEVSVQYNQMTSQLSTVG